MSINAEHGERVGRQHARNQYAIGENMENPYPVETAQHRGFGLELAEILFEEHMSSTYAQDGEDE